MTRADFLRLTGLGSLALATDSFALPAGYTGIPAGIRPYLQTPRPDSMWVSWFSGNAPTGTVEWGPSAGALTQSMAASLDILGTGYHYHSARLTGLTPDSYYYYRVKNGTTVSDTFRFRTPPPAGTKTGRRRVLVMGDNQIIDENRYEKLIACAKAKIETTYGKPIEEVIDFILMPGDQVDVGTLEHYRHLHFKQCGLISPWLPIMTTVGNHETYSDPGLDLYRRVFRYDDISYAGLPGTEGEAYYAYQVGNIAFIHTSSEHTGNVQKAWVRSLVNALKTDPTTDLCVSVVHRPYQAEQYIGDISSWFRSEIMPILAESEKHVLNIGAHHHLYARGQTREWPVYHIISGGTAWDQYWGQSNEFDFDDVQKTIAHWAWQLLDFDAAARTMDVTCYAEANVRLPAATRWNYNSRVIDQFHRRLGLAAPAQPALTNVFTAPVILPITLVSTAYQTSTAEVLNSTWFQVAADAAFTNLKVDRIRDVENLYGDSGAPLYESTDRNAGINLLAFPITAGLANGRFYARVRHRDANAQWSPWSSVIVFTVTGSPDIAEPALRLSKRVYARGEPITTIFEGGPGNPTDWVGLYPSPLPDGGNPDGNPGSTDWKYVSGSRTTGPAGTTSGSLTFANSLATGLWGAWFLANDGYTPIVPKVEFYVGTPPTLVPDKLVYNLGESVKIGFSNAPGRPLDWIGLYRVGKNPGAGSPSVKWSYTPSPAGTAEFAGLEKGYYYAVYLLNDGYFELSQRVPFAVGQQIASVSMASPTFTAGENFSVDFADGPGIPKDWIGIFKEGETPGVNVLTAYLYFGGATSGSVTFKLPDLPPGNYFAVMFTNDSYTEVSNRVPFTAVPPEILPIEEVRLVGTGLLLRWPTETGRSYLIQKSTALNGWTDLSTVVAAGSFYETTLPLDRVVNPSGFFRVKRL
jgi:hypothetical protein